MANANQSANRAGNVFGRDAGAGYVGNDWENIVLKPGYIIKIRDRFHLVEAVEGLTVDLFFNDNFSATISNASVRHLRIRRCHSFSQYGIEIDAASSRQDHDATYTEHSCKHAEAFLR